MADITLSGSFCHVDECSEEQQRLALKTDDDVLDKTQDCHVLDQKSIDLVYGVEDVPPVHMVFLFGFQQVLLSISSTISIPLLVSGYICADDLDLVKAEIVSTFLVMCGVSTVLQCILGVRLPIVQGGCHKFIPAIAALMTIEKWKCPDLATDGLTFENGTNASLISRTEIWQTRMREIQGGIMLASLVQVLLGCSGLMGVLLHFLGPITIVPTISLVGLSLTGVAIRFCEKQWGIAALTIGLVFLFALYLRNILVPCPAWTKVKGVHVIRYPIFKLLPVILAVMIAWAVCGVLTVSNVLPADTNAKYARTDTRLPVVSMATWFFFPYPGQWGTPTVSVASFMGMFAATITSVIESVGDYYACARISGVSQPPAHAINRGIAMEGLGSLISGAVGSGGATTSYSQNVGAIGFTKVASRSAFVCAGFIFIVAGLVGKFGALLTMMPDPVLGGIVVISFGMVTSVGLSMLSYVDLNSSRNLSIIGTSLLIGLMVPEYFKKNGESIKTGNEEFDQVATVLLSTAMFVGGAVAFILDNTVPGSSEERGLLKWRQQSGGGGGSEGKTPYDLPFVTKYLRKLWWTKYIPILPTFRFELCKHS